MSLRSMKKLMEKQQESPTVLCTEEGAEEDDEEEVAVKPAKNNFGLLWSEMVQEDDEGDEEVDEDNESAGGQQASSQASSSSAKKSKKQKKKRNKKKNKDTSESKEDLAQTPCNKSQAGDAEASDLVDGLSLNDSANDRLNVEASSASPALPAARGSANSVPSSTGKPDRRKGGEVKFESLIKADPGLLRAEDELKRIFGAKVMREVDRQDPSSAAQRGALPVARGGARQLGNRRQGRVSAGRKFILVQPLDSWPPVEKGGLMMEQVKEVKSPSTSILKFQYIQSRDYERVSHMLEDCIESHDPNIMVELVARHPFHAEGLLALSDMYRHMGEAQVAAELLERALYVLESAWHPYFNPVQGNCRLDYSWEPNTTLYLALFRNVQQLSRRGCHRAALECAKLLFSLSPEDDPHGMLLCLDYYAIRAEQAQWLEDFVQAHSNKSLSLLPNFAFSLALAQFHREEKEAEARVTGAGSGGQEADDHVQSAELLRDALLLHPYVLPLIIKKAPIQVNPEWSKLLKAKPFCAVHKISPTLEHLCALYSERSSLLWRPTAVQRWLKQVATGVCDGMGKGGDVEQDYANWTCVRQETFGEKSNEYRHLLVSDFSDNISTVPPEILMGAAGAGGAPQEGAPAGPPAPRGPPVDLEGRNPLAVFLETLLPWNDYGVDPNDLPNAD